MATKKFGGRKTFEKIIDNTSKIGEVVMRYVLNLENEKKAEFSFYQNST
jgi:hypothetical protein